jgi:Tol biopolymer transport system component
VLRSRVLIGGLLVAAVVVGASPARADEGAVVVRVSVAADGGQANSSSSYPSISADGRFVAFGSRSVNLIPGDFTSGGVFVKEIATGAITRVGTGLLPTLSGDGRYVAFLSGSSTLVPGDTNGRTDVFVHDREDGTTRRVSVASDSTQADGDSADAAIAAGGRYVVFTSSATTLAPGATGANKKVFVHDLQTGATNEVSVAPNGRSGTRDSSYATISADGRYVAFASQAKELVPGATAYNVSSAYVRDLQTGTTRRLNSGFVKGWVSISADGRYVGYIDSKSDIVPGDTNRVADVFRWDLADDRVARVNVAADGTQADKDSGYVPQGVPMSADGRYVLFESAATNLVPGDVNARRDIFVRDTAAGSTTRVSPDGTNANATAGNYYGSISGAGSAAVFLSELSLEAADTNNAADIYLWNRGVPTEEGGPTEEPVPGPSDPA